MTIAERVRRNGVGAPMPIKTADIKLDEMGWPGWFVTMRTDPPSSVYDSLLAFDDEGRWWTAFGKIVLAWNLSDDDGILLPLPRDAENEHVLDLRIGVISYVFTRYVEILRSSAVVPKVLGADSSTTSSTNGESPKAE